jgi:hypothetical protein
VRGGSAVSEEATEKYDLSDHLKNVSKWTETRQNDCHYKCVALSLIYVKSR